MKKLSPRQQKILEWVAQKQVVSVEEMQRELGVSQATAYREIQVLTQMGLAAKVPGGVGCLKEVDDHCVHCGQIINPRTIFLIEHKDGKKSAACCAHCGLMALAGDPNVGIAMVADFLYGTMLNARTVWYVVDSDIDFCCRPSVLIFSHREDAQRFSRGFGGSVVDFTHAQNMVRQMMAF